MAEGFKIADGYVSVEAKVDKEAARRSGEQAGDALGEGLRRGADGRLRDSTGRFVSDGVKKIIEDDGKDSGKRFSFGFDSILGKTMKDSFFRGITFGLSGLGDASSTLKNNQFVSTFALALGAAIGILGAPAIAANLVAGLGLGAFGTVLAGGIVLAASDPRVKTAAGDLKNQLLDMDTSELEQKVADAQEKLNKARADGNAKAIAQAKTDLATAQAELNAATTFNENNFSLKDAAKPLVDPLITTLKIFGDTFSKQVAPELAKSFAIVAPFLPPLAEAVAQLIVAVLPGFNQFLASVGSETMVTFTKELPRVGAALGKFFEILSKDGPAASTALSDFLHWIEGLIVTIAYVIDWTARAYVSVRNFITAIPGWVSDAGHWISSAWDSFTGWVANLWGEVSSWPGAIGGFFADMGRTIADWARDVADWFRQLPGRVAAGIAALPGLARDLIVRVFDAVTYGIGAAIGATIRFFIDLPGRIDHALTAFFNTVVNAFWATMHGAEDAAVALYNAVTDWLVALPGRAASAVSTLWDAISGAFWAAVHGAENAASALWHGFVNWIQGLPGAASNAAGNTRDAIIGAFRGAGSWLWQAGRDILSGLVDGIQSLAGWVADVVRRAARNIISGFKHELGIASPSKVAAKQVGEPVVQGVMQPIERSAPKIRTAISTLVPDMLPSRGTPTEPKASGHMLATVPVEITIGDEVVQRVFTAVLKRNPEAVASASRAGNRSQNFVFAGRTS